MPTLDAILTEANQSENSLVRKVENTGFFRRISSYIRGIGHTIIRYKNPTGCVTTAITLLLLAGAIKKANANFNEEGYGNDILIANTNTGEHGNFTRVAIDNNGNFVVAWRDIRDLFSSFAQRYDKNGNKIGEEYLIGDGKGFDVAMTKEGYHTFAWNGVFAQRYDKNGNKIGEVLHAGSGVMPSIAMNEEKNFIIAWSELYRDGDGFGVFAQLFNKDGNKVGGEFQVNSYTRDEQNNQAVAISQEGDFVITWQSGWGQDGSQFGIFAQRYDRYGNKLGGEFQVNTYTQGDQSSTSVAMDYQGNFVITWENVAGYGHGSQLGVFAQRFDKYGNRVGGEFQVNTSNPNGRAGAPHMAMDYQGNFVVTWNSDWRDGEIYAQRFRADGSRIGEEFQVNNNFTSGSQYEPRIAMNENEDVVITWGSEEPDYAEKVFARIFPFYNPADFNKDGYVDFKDFGIFSDNWLAYHP